MLIKREIEREMESFLKRREIIAIVGPRQAGKTTILTQLRDRFVGEGKRVAFLNFERPTEAALFEDPDRFADLYCRNHDVIIIDEFHFAREGGRRLKLLYDAHPTTKFLISGSSSLELTFQTGKYLVGRYIPFLLLPFSFREYLTATDPDLAALVSARGSPFDPSFAPVGGAIEDRLESAFMTYAVWGGYPAAVTAASGDRRLILRTLYDTYLMRDVRDLLRLATDVALQTIARLLAGQIGNTVVYAELGTASGLTAPVVKRHLRILEQTYVCSLLAPFFRNRRLEAVKNPKVYFLDSGLRNAILDAWAPLAERADAGALVEQCVFGGLRRQFPPPSIIRFWRSKSGAEVDFITESEGVPIPIEVKWQRDPKLGKSFRSFLDRYAPPRAYVATRATYRRERVGRTDVTAVPAWYWS